MKLSERWLREWIDSSLELHTLAERLTLAGLEVASISSVTKGHFSQVVVGHIVAVSPHVNASGLKVCQVDIGTDQQLTIVCGASNARVQLKVAVALVGACLPAKNNLLIKEMNLRGIPSQGMLCSATELGLDEKTSEGILEFLPEAPIGMDLHDYLPTVDYCIDIHVTPNRGDCLSVQGIARELAAITNTKFSVPFIFSKQTSHLSDKLKIRIESAKACPYYCGRLIRGIKTETKTPTWLAERLRCSGFPVVHFIVDVTNYVLLELGQPLHAYDLAHFGSDIALRYAYKGESICLLGEKQINLDESTLVIADETKIQAIAGIMGGVSSAISETTCDIFLESAFFNPSALAGCARRYGLTSEAAYRFERGVDPALTLPALERATQLLVEIAEGKPGPVLEIPPTFARTPTSIQLNRAHIKRLLGIDLPEEKLVSILKSLGMGLVKQSGQIWEIIPPTWRFDITLEVDLIEELARIWGYNKIPATSPHISLRFLPKNKNQPDLSRLDSFLMDKGYHEVINYSFISPKLQGLIEPKKQALTLTNPISSALSVMRTSLWPGLLNTVIYNQKHQQLSLRLFEIGVCFEPISEEAPREVSHLAAVVTGHTVPEQWGIAKKPVDFFIVKSDVESLLRLLGWTIDIQFLSKDLHPALHPGQSAAIFYRGKRVGYLGALHPRLLTELALIGPIYLFELAISEVPQTSPSYYKPIPKFPIVRRDLSFWVDREFSAQMILDKVRNIGGPYLHQTYLFDVYYDKGIQSNKRSLGLALLWQHPSTTLEDREVNKLVQGIIEGLNQFFAIQLRE